ncbi:MAG: hypothetical protein OJJ55_19010 [Rhodococcus sp.]|nr:hypothetical protein [Rhodococcus sp. (in: high G+C Gram-positive bacteria)]
MTDLDLMILTLEDAHREPILIVRESLVRSLRERISELQVTAANAFSQGGRFSDAMRTQYRGLLHQVGRIQPPPYDSHDVMAMRKMQDDLRKVQGYE